MSLLQVPHMKHFAAKMEDESKGKKQFPLPTWLNYVGLSSRDALYDQMMKAMIRRDM